MKKITYLILLLLLLASCQSLRQQVKRDERNHVQYAHLAFASDSTLRRWYFSSDSGFSYHPDSGLHTRSGELWGWEAHINRRLQQQTVDSMGLLKTSEQEIRRQNPVRCYLRNTFFIVIGAILVIGYVRIKRKK